MIDLPRNPYVRMFVPTIQSIEPACNCVFLDVYDIANGYGVICPARVHALKKILLAGQRGDKGTIQDLQEAIHSLERAIQSEEAKS